MTVRVSTEALERYRTLVRGATVPEGTWVAKEHFDPKTEARGPIYAMHKLADGSWEFVVATAEGALVERGRVDACWRCHAEATADSLFGPGATR